MIKVKENLLGFSSLLILFQYQRTDLILKRNPLKIIIFIGNFDGFISTEALTSFPNF